MPDGLDAAFEIREIKFPSELSSLSFLHLPLYPMYYWRDRFSTQEIIGVGNFFSQQFVNITAFKFFLDTYQTSVHRDTPLFVLMPFFNNNDSRVYPRVVIPASIIVRNREHVTMHAVGGDFRVALKVLNVIEKFPYFEPDFTRITMQSAEFYAGYKKSWQDGYDKLMSRIKEGHLKKVVLANRFLFPNSHQLALSDLLTEGVGSSSDNRFRFLYAEDEYNWFYSRTPERFMTINDNVCQSEALGGTISASEDKISKKVLREHLLIIDDINHYCKELQLVPQWNTIDNATTLNLGSIKHLWHTFHVPITKHVKLSDMLFNMHPTPAVCGVPRKEAREAIREYEVFERGYYAAPVGVVWGQSCDFIVNLRTVFSEKDYFSIPIGVGLLQESDFEEEWQEILGKLRSL
jgi:isochorismate synthase EntC